MSLSLSTCTAQFNSMQSATCSLRLVKVMEEGTLEGDSGTEKGWELGLDGDEEAGE